MFNFIKHKMARLYYKRRKNLPHAMSLGGEIQTLRDMIDASNKMHKNLNHVYGILIEMAKDLELASVIEKDELDAEDMKQINDTLSYAKEVLEEAKNIQRITATGHIGLTKALHSVLDSMSKKHDHVLEFLKDTEGFRDFNENFEKIMKESL